MAQRDLTQVRRIVDGTEYFVFKMAGVRDPLESDLRFEVAASPVPVGYEAYMMWSSNYGTRGGVGKGKWATCATCGSDYPVTEMVRVHGRYYCRENKCNEDFE